MVARLLPLALIAVLLLSGGGLVTLAALGGWLAASVEGADLGLPPGAAAIALEGQLVVEHGHLRDNRGFTNYSLLTAGREVPLRLPRSIVAERPNGQVAVTGRAGADGAIVVDQLRVLAATQPPVSTGPQRTAVILLAVGPNVTNVYGTNKAYTAQLVYGAVPTSANSFYYGASYGQTQIVKGTGDTSPDGSGSIFGPYPVSSISSCSVTTITAQALAAAGSAINPANYDRIVVSLAYPTTPCGFGGVSLIYPVQIGTASPFPPQWQGTWVSYSVVQNTGLGSTPAPTPSPGFSGIIGGTFIHEYGHQLGMYHADTLNCGAVAVLGNQCTAIEYGDKSDVMGNSNGQPGPVHKDVLGWLSGPLVQEVTASGTYVISGYEALPTASPTLSSPPNLTPSATPVGNTRVLKVPRTRDANGVITSHYYLILRQAPLFNNYLTAFPLYNSGVLVYTTGTAAMCSQGAVGSPTPTTTATLTPTATHTPTPTQTATHTPTGSPTLVITATRTTCGGGDALYLGSGGGGDSLLINTQASAQNANNFTVAPLLPGQSYTDAAAGVSFTVTNVNTAIGQATVQVNFTGPPLVQIQPLAYPGIVLPTATPGGPPATPQVILPATFSGGGSYPRGSSVALNVTPGPGYKFAYWRANRQGLTVTPLPFRLTAQDDLTVEAVFGPVNDSPQTALVVSALPTQSVINDEASQNAASLPSCTGTSGPTQLAHGVWYQYTAPNNQPVTVDTRGTVEFVGDTILVVWPPGSSSGTPLTCNTNGHASTVTWVPQAGSTYLVQAGLLDQGLGGLLVVNFAQGAPTPTPTPTDLPATATVRALTPSTTPTIHPLTLTAVALTPSPTPTDLPATATVRALTPSTTPTIHPLTLTAVALTPSPTPTDLPATATVRALTPSTTPTIHPLTLTAIALTPSATTTPSLTPTAQNLTPAQAQAQASGTAGFQIGTPGAACAVTVGQSCAVAGTAGGTLTRMGSMTFALTATVPAGLIAGLTPVAVFSTDQGLQAVTCAPPAAGVAGTTFTCAGSIAGNALAGSTAALCFTATTPCLLGSVAASSIAPVAASAPLLPPPPPLPALPPPPPPPSLLLPPPPLALPAAPPVQGPGVPAEVPVIPEGESLLLLSLGLGALGLHACWRRRQRL